MIAISRKEVYILAIVLVYMLHSLVYEYIGTTTSLEWIASFYVLDYLIVALMSFLVKIDSKVCGFALNTMGIFKVICVIFIIVSYFISSTVIEFWDNVENIAPFYSVILLSIGLSILTEWIKIKKIKLM